MKTSSRLFFLIVVLLLFIPACRFIGGSIPDIPQNLETKPAAPSVPSTIPQMEPTVIATQPSGFTASDCSANGLTFTDITAGLNDFEPYDGPSLICHSSTTGSHGLSEVNHLNINKMLSDHINTAFDDQKTTHKIFIDQAIAWKEKNPTAGTEVVKIRDDATGYIYIILTEANVQGCLLGEGYGVEILNNYLINYLFSSCEGDAASYTKAMETLQKTAQQAIERINTR